MQKVYQLLEQAEVQPETLEYLKERIKKLKDGTAIPEGLNLNDNEIDNLVVIYVQGFVESLSASEQVEDSVVDEVLAVLADSALEGDSDDEDEDEEFEDEDDDDYDEDDE